MRKPVVILVLAALSALGGFMFLFLQDVIPSKTIVLTSQISKTNATWSNKKYLEQYLDSLGFWDDKKVFVNGQGESVHNLELILTPNDIGSYKMQRQVIEEDDVDLETLTSYSLEYNANTKTLRIYQYVNTETYALSFLTSPNRTKQYELALLMTLFQIRKTPQLQDQSTELTKQLTQIQNAYNQFSQTDEIFSL